jgi:Na+-transporting NADH:ubiquinone oxidoreductase subunit A
MVSSIIRIKRGFDVRLAGPPAAAVADVPPSATVAVCPGEFAGLRPRLKVKEGDAVRRGTPLLEDKTVAGFQLCAPAAGTVAAIEYGERRAIRRIVIRRGASDEAEALPRLAAGGTAGLAREAILENLKATGYLSLIRQRPLSRMADPAVTPKSIFVNGMNTAPFAPDLHVVVRGQEDAFQAGLDILGRLTAGRVYLCLGPEAEGDGPAVNGARNVEIRRFSGPHPSGNTSVHIHLVDAISPGDRVWAVKGVDVVRIGRLFLDGAPPATRIVSLAGPGVRDGARRHYRVGEGTDLASLLADRLAGASLRVVAGDALGGERVAADGSLPFLAGGLTVLREDPERRFLGWMAPGFGQYSASALFPSRWLSPRKAWDLGTNLNGGHRAMVATGLYDRVLPMNILVDQLVRAVLAHDVEEAVQLGLLEVDPEDFALCSFVCPSKTDLVGIIRKGLDEAAAEGL